MERQVGLTDEPLVDSSRYAFAILSNQLFFHSLFVPIGTLRLSESDSQSSNSSAYPNATTHSAKLNKPTTPLDVLSSDYADMTLGNAKHSMRNTGPTLSPKESIKKLKSSFFGCSKIDEHKMDCSSTSKPATNSTMTVTTNSKNSTCDEGDYTLMNPILSRRIVAQQPPIQSATQAPFPATATTKKTALVTSDPDKVMANTQVRNSIDGFKPIASRADKEMYQQNKSTPTSNASSFSRQHSAPVEKQRKPSNDNSGYELLELRSSSSSHSMGGRIARPNSVNSEKTTFTPLMRPNSANSERQSTSTFSLTSTPLNETGTQSVSIQRNCPRL